MARKAKLQFTYLVSGKKNSATIPNLIPRFISGAGPTPTPPGDYSYGGQIAAFVNGYIGLITGATLDGATYSESMPISEIDT